MTHRQDGLVRHEQHQVVNARVQPLFPRMMPVLVQTNQNARARVSTQNVQGPAGGFLKMVYCSRLRTLGSGVTSEPPSEPAYASWLALNLSICQCLNATSVRICGISSTSKYVFLANLGMLTTLHDIIEGVFHSTGSRLLCKISLLWVQISTLLQMFPRYRSNSLRLQSLFIN